MKFDSSLRMRLFMLIMTPLIVIAGILGYWGLHGGGRNGAGAV